MQAIADLAGVSRATVDKVIHNRPGVSESVREQIKNIIIETNYKPVHVRKHLKEDKPQTRIAVIMPELQNSFMRNVKAGMDTSYLEYQPYGLYIDYYYNNGYDPQQTIAILTHLKEIPVSGIALHTVNNPQICQLINEFTDRGVPVFTFDMDLPDSKRTCFIGEDPYRIGQIAASLLCKSIDRDSEIAILTSSQKVRPCELRIKGFTAYVEKYAPDARVVSIEETLNQHALTYQKTYALLNRFPNLKGIWNCAGHSEDMAQAVIDSGKKDQVKLISLFFTPEIIHLIKEGIIEYTLGQTPYKLGKLIIKSLYEYLTSPSPDISAPSNIWTPVYIGCDANIDTFEDSILKG
jgi:LacI family transcriptional regulator